MTIERLLAEIVVQIRWANDRQCEAEANGDKEGKEAWGGYVQALRWVEESLKRKDGK